jgi:hypothetical protein
MGFSEEGCFTFPRPVIQPDFALTGEGKAAILARRERD